MDNDIILGYTVLSWAVIGDEVETGNELEILKELLKANVDVNGRSPSSYGKISYFKNIVLCTNRTGL